jgi:hypothetical protein
MATRSSIAVQHEDSYISQIYCHSDGYLSWNGAKLLQHYNTFELASELVSHGDASVIYGRIHPTGEHSFNKPESGVCIFYGRDRGEKHVSPTVYMSMNEYIKNGQFHGYDYIFMNGIWLVTFADFNEFIPLNQALLRFERDTAIKIGLQADTGLILVDSN